MKSPHQFHSAMKSPHQFHSAMKIAAPVQFGDEIAAQFNGPLRRLRMQRRNESP